MSNNDTVQLEKAAALDGKSVVIYITNGEEAQSTSPDFYHVDITYQDDEYIVPASIQLATKDRSDVLYLSRDEQHYEKGLGDESTGLLGNDTQRFTVEYVSINGIKIESTDLTTIKNLMQATSVGYEVEKQRDASNPMKVVDEEDKPVKKYKKKRKVNKSMIEKLLDLFEKEEMDEYEYVLDEQQDIAKSETTTIVKQLEEEQMIAIEPLYIKAGDVDAHGDSITEEEVYKMVDNFNKNIDNIKGNIHHKMFTDAFRPLRAFVAPADMYIGDIEKRDEMVLVPKGQPIVEVQFAKTEEGMKLWEDRKAGVVRGVSIGAQGVRVPNPEYSEEADE